VTPVVPMGESEDVESAGGGFNPVLVVVPWSETKIRHGLKIRWLISHYILFNLIKLYYFVNI